MRDLMMQCESLTYEQLAQRLGITRQSARQLAMRRRWSRKLGNDGMARVSVPLEALTQHEARIATRPEAASDTALTDLLAGLATAQSEMVDLARKLGVEEGEIEALRRQSDEALRRAQEIAHDRDRWAAIADELARRPQGLLAWLRRA